MIYEEEIDVQELLDENIELGEQQKELNKQIAILKQENKEKDRKNLLLQKNIDELIKESKKVEEQMDKTRKESTIVDIKIEPKFYLKGMFDHFNNDHSTLCILVEGREYHYPIESYQCLHLPMAGSRVLIFKSEEGKHLIYGFDISNIIDPAKKIKAEVKSYIPARKMLKVSTKEYGYLNLEVENAFFKNISVKLGTTVILNQVNIDGDYYFSINESIQGNSMRDRILKTLLKEVS